MFDSDADECVYLIIVFMIIIVLLLLLWDIFGCELSFQWEHSNNRHCVVEMRIRVRDVRYGAEDRSTWRLEVAGGNRLAPSHRLS